MTIRNLRTVQRAVWEARPQWYNIGLELYLRVGDLDVIRANHDNMPEDCFREMLVHWLKRVDPPPTWSALVAALGSWNVGYEDLAEHVMSTYVHVSDVTDSGPTSKIQGGGFIG